MANVDLNIRIALCKDEKVVNCCSVVGDRCVLNVVLSYVDKSDEISIEVITVEKISFVVDLKIDEDVNWSVDDLRLGELLVDNVVNVVAPAKVDFKKLVFEEVEVLVYCTT